MSGSIRGADPDLVLRLDELRQEQGDTVSTDQVIDVVQSIFATISGDVSVGDLRLYHELESLAEYIKSAKQEISALRPNEINSQFIASATDELDAIVGSTEDATNEVMDAAEKIEDLIGEMGLEGDLADRLSGLSTRLFEACSFQDLTGQRITKIVRMLKEIESRVAALVHAFGGNDVPDQDAPPPPVDDHPEAGLLNGPQLPDAASDQDEIDRLFASM